MRLHHVFALAFFAALAVLGAGDAGAGSPSPNTLTAGEEREGWKLLFDGKTLDGWHVFKRKGTDGWTVKDGAIYLEKPGSGDLMTDAKYANFEFSVDWKFDKPGAGNNSGIIYRTSGQGGQTWETGPEMQVMTAGPKAKLGKNSGGALYDLYAPSLHRLKPADQWNTFKVVANGKHLEQWVNGAKVVDCEIGSEDWNGRIARSKWKDYKQFAQLPAGHIALQDHGARIAFRNVKIRVLPAAEK